MVFIGPAAVLAVGMLGNLVLQQGKGWGVWLGYVGGVALLCGAMFGAVARRDARFRAEAPADVALESFGRFRLDEWAATPELRDVLSRLDGGQVRGLARGWAEGRLWFTADELQFRPGRIAKSGGIPKINIPWSVVEHVEVAPQAMSMACGLRLFLEGGTTLDLEMRGRRPSIESALERTALGDRRT